jgi:hypothetical protein
MPAAKPMITSEVSIDRDVYPELYAALSSKPKGARAEMLRALAAEALTARGMRRGGRREAPVLTYEDVPAAPAPAPVAEPAAHVPSEAATTASAPAAAALAASSQIAPEAVEARSDVVPIVSRNPARSLPLHTLTGRSG